MSKNFEKKKIAKSPERFTFQRDRYIKRKSEEGKTTDNDEDVAAMVAYFDKVIEDSNNREINEEWKRHNLEYDLRTTDWICKKVKEHEAYAQNLYAALCNNDFLPAKLENTAENTLKVLKEDIKSWHCSWRYAGGIVADMREEGDYIDWFCSGIRDDYEGSSKDRNYVSEGVVTDEIREDLKQIGWVVINEDR